MSVRQRWVVFGLVVILGAVADQATKALARAYLSGREPIVLAGGAVRLAYGENAGAFLGLGAELSPVVRTLLFGVFAALLLVAVAVYVFTAPRLKPLDVVAGALLVAGGVGNLIDRALHQGRVIDFVTLRAGPLRTGVFNLADVFVMAGVGWFLVSTLQEGGEPPDS